MTVSLVEAATERPGITKEEVQDMISQATEPVLRELTNLVNQATVTVPPSGQDSASHREKTENSGRDVTSASGVPPLSASVDREVMPHIVCPKYDGSTP